MMDNETYRKLGAEVAEARKAYEAALVRFALAERELANASSDRFSDERLGR